MGLLNFRLTRVHSALLHGIAEVEGHAGFWPFRRQVRFRVGLNCDAIRVQERRLVVWRAARPIATAKTALGQAGKPAPADSRWEQLLQPRDRNKR